MKSCVLAMPSWALLVMPDLVAAQCDSIDTTSAETTSISASGFVSHWSTSDNSRFAETFLFGVCFPSGKATIQEIWKEYLFFFLTIYTAMSGCQCSENHGLLGWWWILGKCLHQPRSVVVFSSPYVSYKTAASGFDETCVKTGSMITVLDDPGKLYFHIDTVRIITCNIHYEIDFYCSGMLRLLFWFFWWWWWGISTLRVVVNVLNVLRTLLSRGYGCDLICWVRAMVWWMWRMHRSHGMWSSQMRGGGNVPSFGRFSTMWNQDSAAQWEDFLQSRS